MNLQDMEDHLDARDGESAWGLELFVYLATVAMIALAWFLTDAAGGGDGAAGCRVAAGMPRSGISTPAAHEAPTGFLEK